jgi:hypothetical protein
MTRRRYHCFIAGLPELSLDEMKAWISIESFKEILWEILHPDDYQQVRLVFMNEDHRNLIGFLQGNVPFQQGTGNYSQDDFERQRSLFSSILPAADILPPYMVQVMKDAGRDEKEFDANEASHRLEEGYDHYIREQGSRFQRSFHAFECNLKNLLTYMKAGEHQRDQKKYLTGNTPLAQHLRELAGKNIASFPEFEWFEEVLSYTVLSSLAEEELQFDRLRWLVIEELIFFEDFTIDWILGYLHQMLILDRWSKLKKEDGKARLSDFLDEARQESIHWQQAR